MKVIQKVYLLTALVLQGTHVSTSQPSDEIHKVIIIGSGVAGLTAALYCAREQLQPLVIEGEEWGGMLVNAGPVENWAGQLSTIGPELVATIHQQAEKEGAQFVSDIIVKVDFKQRPFTLWTASGKEYKSHAVIAATGSLPRKLHCPGEEEYWGRGVAICVLCDGPLFANKTIVVVGGGDLALDKALFLTRFASKVIIAHRKDKLTASPYMQQKIAANSKISTIPNAVITEIRGNGSTVTGVKIEDQKNQSCYELPTDGVFLAIGFDPCTAIFKNELELTPEGYIALTHFTKTSVEGVFAAGNVAGHGYRPAMTAAGTGCMAGIDAETYLTNIFDTMTRSKHYFCPHKRSGRLS